jgi:hypothetical protein
MGRGGMAALRGPTMRLEIAGLRFGNSHGSRPGLSRVIFYNEVNGHTEGKLSPGGVDRRAYHEARRRAARRQRLRQPLGRRTSTRHGFKTGLRHKFENACLSVFR